MTERMRRVNESVRHVVSEALPELKDPRIGFVTVTGVQTSPDLRHARVFVSVLGSERTRERSVEALQAAARQRAEDEANPPADVRVRSVGRARGPGQPTDR